MLDQNQLRKGARRRDGKPPWLFIVFHHYALGILGKHDASQCIVIVSGACGFKDRAEVDDIARKYPAISFVFCPKLDTSRQNPL
jgi:hypothetical protein